MPLQRKANQAPFHLFCSAVPNDTFVVREFTGNERIGDVYDYDLSLASARNDIDIAALIATRATLFTNRHNTWLPVSGIISHATYESHSVDYALYRLHLRPTLYKTTLSTRCRVFQKMTVPAIIEQVLGETGLDGFYEVLFTAEYPEREYVVQYNETDFNFICRLMDVYGIWYYFSEEPLETEIPNGVSTQELLIITDDPSSFKEIHGQSTIIYRSPSSMHQHYDKKEQESIYALEEHQRAISAETAVKKYCYATPEMDISSVKNIADGDTGKVYRYGGVFTTTAEAEQQATIMANRIATSKMNIAGKSTCTALRPGFSATFIDHPRESCNITCNITSVTHHGTMLHSGSTEPVYTNNFTGFPSDYASTFCPPVTATKPSIPDILTARIEGSGGHYATLDEKGRYRIRMPFDLSDAPTGAASPYIRLAQLYSGSDYGLHFPVHEGAEIVIAHVNGDPDMPVGLKVVPDGNTISPVTDRNHTESVIRTAGNNEIVMDDNEGREHLKIYTPGSMYMQADHDGSESADGDRSVKVGGNEKKCVEQNATSTIKGNRTIEIGGNRSATISGSSRCDVTKKGTISVDGSTTLKVSGDQNETFSKTRTLEVSGNNTETISGDYGCETDTISTVKVTGNLNIEAGADFGASAKAALIISGTSVTLKAETQLAAVSGQASVALAADGIAISGATITMTAGMVDSSAKTNNNVTGLAVLLN